MPIKYRLVGRRAPQPKRLAKKKAIVKLSAGVTFELLKFKENKKAKVKSKVKKKTTKKVEEKAEKPAKK